MEPRAHATLDDPILRNRIRRNFVQLDYTRSINKARPKPTLLSDITIHRAIAPKPLRKPNPSSQLTSQISKQLVSQEPKTSKNFVKPVLATTEYINSPAQDNINKSHFRLLRHSRSRTKRREHLKLKDKSKLQLALVGLAIIFILFGGYVSIMGLRANKVAVFQAAKLTQLANKAAKSKVPTNIPATIKPTTAAVANFVVAPNLPRYIIIPKIGVDAEVRSVGLTSSGALGVPDNVYYTDWYDESSLPGQQGAMLIDGHVSSWTAHGVFYGIKTLVAGDIIKIVRGDGTVFTYTVVKHQIYPSGNVNMTSAMTPIVAGQPGLNLITCTGDVIPGTSLFNERIIVYATLQQS